MLISLLNINKLVPGLSQYEYQINEVLQVLKANYNNYKDNSRRSDHLVTIETTDKGT